MTDEAPPPTHAERAGEEDIPGARMAALTAYLETHRAAYTEAALRRAALDAGYGGTEIDAAWHRLTTAGPTEDPALPAVSAATAGITFIVTIVAGWLAVSALETVARTLDPNVPWGVAAWLGAGLVGVVLWWINRRSHPSFARGIGCAVLVVIVLPIVLFVALLGICLASGSSLLGT